MKHFKGKLGSVFISLTLSLLLGISIVTSIQINNDRVSELSAWSGTQISNEGSYYEEARGLSGTALKTKLDTIISRNVSTSYDWPRYEAADEAENESSKVLQIYTRTTIAKTAHVSGSLGWNREHTYPDSKIGSPANSDNLHIFASDNRVNSIRGSKLFGIVTPKDSSTDVQDSLGNTIDAYTNSSTFEPTDAAKGEVARATLYLNTAYGYSITGNFTSESLCLDWAQNYPVTNREIYRNNIVHTLQGNRNPYIDHPEFIDMVYDPSYSGAGALNDLGEVIEPVSLSLNPSSVSINVGQTQTLTVSAQPAGASTSVIWASSNPHIASISNGLVTAISEGFTTVTATSSSSPSISATANITVNPPQAPTSFALSETSFNLSLGASKSLSINASPSGANNSAIWSTSNPGVALVDSGTIYGIALGSAVITATSSVNSGVSASASVTVVEASALTMINNYQNIVGGNYLITVNYNSSSYYLPTQAGGFATGSSTITSFSDVMNIDESNAWTFTNSGTNSWKISNGNYYLNCTTTNDGIGATTGGSSDYWTASQGSSGILLKSHAGARYLTGAFVGVTTPEWRGYGTADTNGTSQIILYLLGSGTSVSPAEEAEDWALDFLSQTSAGCQNKSASQLEIAWNNVSSSYISLSDATKMVISYTIPNEFGSNIENALARYIDIINKYDFEPFINGVNTASNHETVTWVQEKEYSSILILISIILVSSGLILVIINKRNFN